MFRANAAYDFVYISAPACLNSLAFSCIPVSMATSSATCFCAAYSLTSCVIFIEQKCGPHIEQKCASLAPSCGNVSSSNSCASSGSSARLNWSSHLNSKRALDKALSQRSEEHTSELQSLAYLVCRLLLV